MADIEKDYSDIVRDNIKKVIEEYYIKGDKFLEDKKKDLKDIKNKLEKEGNTIKTMYDLYETITSISNYLQTGGSEDSTLNYSLYYVDKDGDMVRINQKDIPIEAIEQSSSQLRIKESYLKELVKKVKNEIKGQENFQKHFNNFYNTIGYTYNGKNFPNRTINRGVISEAFERHLNNLHKEEISKNDYSTLPINYDWTVDEAWELIRLSKGSSAFYRGGDIQGANVNTQVKEITYGYGHVRLARFGTLNKMLDKIIVFLDTKPENINNFINLFIEHTVKQDGKAIKEYAIRDAKKLAYENFEDINILDKNSTRALRISIKSKKT